MTKKVRKQEEVKKKKTHRLMCPEIAVTAVGPLRSRALRCESVVVFNE